MIYDISPTISSALKVFPGDTPSSRELIMDIKRGDHLTLSTWRSTVHIGAHIDGPNHYGEDVHGVDQIPLDACLGPCQVISVNVERGTRFGPEAIGSDIQESRVLFKTGTFPNVHEFNPDFAAVQAGLIDWLADKGVQLVGIDTPSVDLSTSKELPSHQACLARHVHILEGIVLKDVPDGAYELIALPLKLKDFDASPVRAVLRKL